LSIFYFLFQDLTPFSIFFGTKNPGAGAAGANQQVIFLFHFWQVDIVNTHAKGGSE